MKNPMNRRFLRELKGDVAKYVVIFLFLTLTIGFVSGFLVSDNSLIHAYDESFEKYNIEDGHFELAARAGDDFTEELQSETGVSLYPLFYKEVTASGDHLLRIYKIRRQVNLVSLHQGSLPEKADEITLDRLYAKNNGYEVGDTIETEAGTFEICGLTAFSDYSALFKKNTDSMFDAQGFSVALVSDEAFNGLAEKTGYVYAWKGQLELEETVETAAKYGLTLTDFIEEEQNQAIHFTGEDMGGDKQMILWLMYIVMAIMAFVFSVTSVNTIEQESTVIGTLRACGYSRGELIRHYMVLPLVVTAAAAVAGNILGYTVFKDYMASLYYGSYSLPPYETLWNSEAFLLTTVSPLIIMAVVNLAVLGRKFLFSPLDFLRRDLKRKQNRKSVKLPAWSFFTRFRLRVILQNRGSYFMLLVGILFVNVLLVFGMMMSPLLDHHREEIEGSMFSRYQYVLTAPVEADDEKAEKYTAHKLELDNTLKEEVMVYGIEENSAYLEDLDLPDLEGEAVVSDGYLEKYGLSVGDEICLQEPFEDETYTFRIAGSYHYPAGFALFLTREECNRVFGQEKEYFNGYFSDEKLSELPEQAVASIITQKDLTIISDQLESSMGSVFPIFGGFAVVIYLIILYLLTKIVIEKNAGAISMVKIMGYENREISKLYGRATTFVVVLSLAITLPVAQEVIKVIYFVMLQRMSGWLPFYVAPDIYWKAFLLGLCAYALIQPVIMRKIKKVPMEEALKNGE